MSYDTHRAALDRYGLEAQILQTCEETAELQQALLHYLRGRQSDVVGEVADVLIMAQQMRMAFGAEEVDKAIEFKLDRLRRRMDTESRAIANIPNPIFNDLKWKPVDVANG